MQNDTIYDNLGVPTVINAAGTKTRIGGSRIRPEALNAMREAADSFVRLSDLQARASDLITDVTGAEAGYVTSGAAGGLLLGAAACIAGENLDAMAQLPDTTGVADEIIMPRTHRSGYDHALRAAGATIVDVGTNDHHLGTGAANVEPWEIRDAISEDTAAVAYMQKPYTEPPLETVVKIAHENDVPVIVDAAAELPPQSNLERFIELGADLVAFSGGKAIRGPQTTGILAGRRDLIESVAVQHLDMHAAEAVWEPSGLVDTDELAGVPRQGIGRPLKVGKEELVGLIRALELFMEEDQEALQDEWSARVTQIAEGLSHCNGVSTQVADGGKVAVAPEVSVSLDSAVTAVTTTELVRDLRKETPRVFVGADSLPEAFSINPMCLTDEEGEYVVNRIIAHVNSE
ncbi:aminotransferase class V-fold PLP-dependent enzyme [Halorussus salinus]|uniref:aminotransferase class V-fold PLP-dependent enzyme n=1 Tax=Halorussus salinus TaxID=1364935 RepID=UPI001091F0DB|nr:aminotransferase class V-fold PLP-dependent enzyme [Halorussus salinus]